MKKFLLFNCLWLITNFVYSQTYKKVDADVLNLRENAGEQYKVIDKIHKGEKVRFFNVDGKWSKIETTNGIIGFVSSEFLGEIEPQTINTSNSNDKTKLRKTEISIWAWIIPGGIILLIIIVVAGGYSSKCPDCGKWFALDEKGKVIIDEQKTSVKKDLKDKNSKGEVIRTREIYIPGTKYTYLVTSICSKCQSQFEHKEYKTIED